MENSERNVQIIFLKIQIRQPKKLFQSNWRTWFSSNRIDQKS